MSVKRRHVRQRQKRRLPPDLRDRSAIVETHSVDDTAATAAIAGRDGRGPRLVLASNSAMAPSPGDDPLTRFFVKPVVLPPCSGT